MRSLLCFLVLFVIQGSVIAADLVRLDYHHSMRIPHQRVSVGVEPSGKLKLSIQSRGKPPVVSTKTIPGTDMAALRKELAGVDWNRAAKDEVRGLDGTSVHITHGQNKVRLWSPDYDTKKRGLSGAQGLVEHLFKLAGLDRTGIPVPVKNK